MNIQQDMPAKSATVESQITHETEVHRQHVRLKIPIQVEIDGRAFTVDDWSVAGFGINAEMTDRQPGETIPVRLVFPFEDFEVAMQLDAQMVYILEDHTRFGCRFLTLGEGQLSLFRYLIDAYLSGELVMAGDLLSISGRDNSAEARRSPSNFNPFATQGQTGRLAKRAFGSILLLGAGVLVAAIAGFGLKERFFTIHAHSATVTADLVRVRAPVAGVLRPIPADKDYNRGEPIARIEEALGNVALVESPCTCSLFQWTVFPDQFTQQGELIAVLDPGQQLEVRAQVAFDDATGIAIGDTADIRIPGLGDPLIGIVDRVDFKPMLRQFDPSADPETSLRLVQVFILTEEPLAPDLMGSLADVRFP